MTFKKEITEKKSETVFNSLIKLSGMTHTEAAIFLNLARGTVGMYCYTPNAAPEKHIKAMRGLLDMQKEEATRLIENLTDKATRINENGDIVFTFTQGDNTKYRAPFCETDYDALQLGFPCANAYNTAVAMTLAGIDTAILKRIVT